MFWRFCWCFLSYINTHIDGAATIMKFWRVLERKKIKIRVGNSKYSCFCLNLPREVVITPVLHPLSCAGFLLQSVKIKERSCSWKGRKQSLKMAAYTRWLSFHISFWGELPKQTFSLKRANGTQKKEGNNYYFL